MKKITRRGFLKGMAITGTALALKVGASDFASRTDQKDRPYTQWRVPNSEWMMIIDLSKCDGCKDQKVPECTQACITGHYAPEDHEYIKVFEVVNNEFARTDYFPRP